MKRALIYRFRRATYLKGNARSALSGDNVNTPAAHTAFAYAALMRRILLACARIFTALSMSMTRTRAPTARWRRLASALISP